MWDDADWVIVDLLTNRRISLAIRDDFNRRSIWRYYIDVIVARHGVPVSIISDRSWADFTSPLAKRYADKRPKPLEFEVGDQVLLNVSPWKGVVRFRKKGKLAPRYVGPFEILERIGLVAYRLRLPEELSSVHDIFHVSNLKKCLADANLHVPLDEIKVDETLCFVKEPIEIMEREIKKLKHRNIALVKVRWNSKRGPEFTREHKDQMRNKNWLKSVLVFAITTLKNELRKLNGKNVVDTAVSKPNATIPPGMFKLDIEPISHRLKNNRDAHEGIRGVKPTTSASGSKPSGNTKNNRITRPPSTCVLCPEVAPQCLTAPVVTPTSGILVYSRRPKATRSVCSSSKVKIVESKTSNSKEPKQSWGSIVFDVSSSSLNDCSKFLGTVIFGNDHIANIMGYGDYQMGNVTISRVYYVEGLGHNLFSVGQFCDSNLEVAFRKHTCFFRDLNDVDLLKGSRGLNFYTLSMDNLLLSSPICLLSKASKTKYWLWHQRLSHLNFDYINYLAKRSSLRSSKTKVSEGSFVLYRKLTYIYLHVFGALCYPTNDGEDLGKLKPKDDIGIFLIAMASEQFSSGPRPNLLTPGTVSSGLVPNIPSLTSYVPQTKNDWEIMFQPMFDEYLNPPPCVDLHFLAIIVQNLYFNWYTFLNDN
ncbi:integrase, catalytic region, zinc finger, CCHC-type containing protein [Tanacetum coccineum]